MADETVSLVWTEKTVVCAKAAPNIALIKYWGKRGEGNLPLDGSLSVTLDYIDLCTTSRVRLHPSHNRLVVNHTLCYEGESLPERVKQLLAYLAGHAVSGAANLLIESDNSFPMASGLASSASSMSSIALAVSAFYGIADRAVIDTAARIGSGSACRSMYGGFVEWTGSEPFLPRQIHDSFHWPDLAVLIMVFDHKAKKVSSTVGMERSVNTSQLLPARRAQIESRIETAKQLIAERNFDELADVIMTDSNQLHAICLDTYPPLLYLNEQSHKVIEVVHGLNSKLGSFLASECPELAKAKRYLAYSFDAGPNAFIFTIADYLPYIWAMFKHFPRFKKISVTGMAPRIESKHCDIAEAFIDNAKNASIASLLESIVQHTQRIIITKPGNDPYIQIDN